MTPLPDNTHEITPTDWLLFMLIVLFGGSSFAMIRGAVETIPPMVIGPVRLWVGAITLYVLMRAAGRRLPPFLARTPDGLSIRRSWRWMIAVGLVGNVLPFFIFPWAQQYVDSGLAGIYMAFMPIWTIILAYFFASEALTRNKIIGFGLGFLGILVLMGPSAATGAASTDVKAQLAILLATVLYAASAVIARMAPPIRPRVFATGMIVSAAIAATPALFLVDITPANWSASSIASAIGLGIFPTGLAGILIIILIRRAGAGFMSLANYVTPVWAVMVGAVVFHERLAPQAFIALAIILVGVSISQRKKRGIK